MRTASNATATTPTLPVAEDVGFTGISGIRRTRQDGTTEWHLCLGRGDRTGVARGPDFKTAMAAALKDLSHNRLPSLVP